MNRKLITIIKAAIEIKGKSMTKWKTFSYFIVQRGNVNFLIFC